MVQKHFYEAPESELLLVKFEENFLTSPVPGEAGETIPYNPYSQQGDF